MGGVTETQAYQRVRQQTNSLAEPLSAEDCQVQSMPDASPAKWHLAHTTWFFETFVLANQASYRPFDERFAYLFNSYYEAAGPRHARSKRGLVTRPSLTEVLRYRRQVDEAIVTRLAGGSLSAADRDMVALGLHHEQQHQELLLTDIQHALWCNPLKPAYRNASSRAGSERRARTASSTHWASFAEGLYRVGADSMGFSYDNEGPRHQVFLQPFEVAQRAVTNEEYLQFVRDNGYQRPELWLSDGWHWVRREQRRYPLYWQGEGMSEGEPVQVFSLMGLTPLELAAPVCHLNYYEAAAFAAWAGCRLPTEFEWEVATRRFEEMGDARGEFLESGSLRPSVGSLGALGDVWEWTSSAYSAYPGFRPAIGAVGEYNGKFMCGQQVLRGGSCVTPEGHIRASYRNFFPPEAQWQFSGLRLAR